MKKRLIPLVLGSLLASSASYAAEEAAADKTAVTTDETTIIATVNGTNYLLDVFRLFYMERLRELQSENTPELQQTVFNEFINLALTAQEAERRELTKRNDVKAGLELQKIKILSNVALQSIAQDIEITDEDLKAAYETLKERVSGAEYKARHILVKDEEKAKELIKQLDDGADFAKLATENSLGPTAKNGGQLPNWFNAQQMVKPFSDAVAAMTPGTYAKTPTQTDFGWHVIELQETRAQEPPTFEEAKPRLTAALQRQQVGLKLAEMRKDAKIDLNDEVVKLKDDAPASDDAEKK